MDILGVETAFTKKIGRAGCYLAATCHVAFIEQAIRLSFTSSAVFAL